jgi:hypothetical protein
VSTHPGYLEGVACALQLHAHVGIALHGVAQLACGARSAVVCADVQILVRLAAVVAQQLVDTELGLLAACCAGRSVGAQRDGNTTRCTHGTQGSTQALDFRHGVLKDVALHTENLLVLAHGHCPLGRIQISTGETHGKHLHTSSVLMVSLAYERSGDTVAIIQMVPWVNASCTKPK